MQFEFHNKQLIGLMNEEVAEQLGVFIKNEFLKAIRCEEKKIRDRWENGDKGICENGSTYLLDEKEPEYLSITEKFTPVGADK